jgi:hypothetical protein
VKQALADGKFFLEQKNSVHHTLPNQTFTDRLTLKLGDREIQIAGDQPNVNRAFEIQLVDWFLHRVYDELNGPLADAIAPIPPK